MRYITWYALTIVVCVGAYLTAWGYDWYRHLDTDTPPNLEELRAFLHEIASGAWIAVIGFLAKSFIDNNHNGIPDQYEQETTGDDKDERN